ncbi:hypothetical protein LCER1_G008921, partial [Lachnellula cervina]
LTFQFFYFTDRTVVKQFCDIYDNFFKLKFYPIRGDKQHLNNTFNVNNCVYHDPNAHIYLIFFIVVFAALNKYYNDINDKFYIIFVTINEFSSKLSDKFFGTFNKLYRIFVTIDKFSCELFNKFFVTFNKLYRIFVTINKFPCKLSDFVTFNKFYRVFVTIDEFSSKLSNKFFATFNKFYRVFVTIDEFSSKLSNKFFATFNKFYNLLSYIFVAVFYEPHDNISIIGSSSVVSPTLAFTTSTVYATSIYTVVQCPASVTPCPIGSITTEIIGICTTICPITATETGKGVPNSFSSPSGVPTSSAPAGEKYTTSTVYTTSAYTITSCAPPVTNCPAKIGSVTTETIALYTTIFPVKPSRTPQPPSGFSISTIYTTSIYTITKCASPITSCPVGSVTTEVISLYTTICPITQSAINTVLASQPNGVPARPVSTLLSAAVLPTQSSPAAGRASISVASPAVSSTSLPIGGASTLGAGRNASSTSTSTTSTSTGLVGVSGAASSSTATTNSGAVNGGIGMSLVLVIAMLTMVL